MPTRDEIIEGMLFSGLYSKDPLNTTAGAVYTFEYQFATTTQPEDLPTGTTYTGWTAFTAAEKAAIRAVMDHIESLINVEFVEITGSSDPDMNLGKVSLPGATAGFGGWSNRFIGDTITDYDNYAVFDNTIDISSGQDNLILHELGHAMGLKHTFSSPTVPTGFDNNKWSVMSYTANPDNGLDSTAMQVFDILALQDFWGQNDDTATGDNTYTGSRTTTIDTVWDAGGTDTFDGSDVATGVTIDLREGRFSNFSGIDDVAIAYDTVIENAIGGAGADRLFGNGVENRISGGGKRDKIYGFGDIDTLLGQGGGDKIYGGAGADIIKGGGGRDLIQGDGGRDKLWGNQKADTFVFTDAAGVDTIKDFEDGIDRFLVDHADVSSVADVMALGDDKGGNAIFKFSDGKVKVIGMSVADMEDNIDVA